MIFEIEGHIVPCQRVNAKGKYSPRAQRYHASQEAIRWQLRQQMQEHDWQMLPDKTPLCVKIDIEVNYALHRCDLDNLIKGCADAAQGIVFENDAYVHRIEAKRRRTDREYAKMEVLCL